MKFDFSDLLQLAILIGAVVATFFGTKHSIKEYTRDRLEAVKDDINNIKIELEKMRSKDDNQQQIIDQIGKQMNDLLPKLLEALNSRKHA